MENFPFNVLRHDKYNHFTSVDVLFYSKNTDGAFGFLLLKKRTEQKYHTMGGQITELDSTAMFTAARLVVQELRGCISDANLQKLIEHKKLTENDLIPTNLGFHEIWEHSVFFEMIRKFLASPCSIDVIEGRLTLVIGLPHFNLESINNLLQKAPEGPQLKWVSLKNLKTSNEVDLELRQLANFVDIPSHIETTLSWQTEEYEEADTYIVLSCKPVNQLTAVDPLYLHFPALFQGFFKRGRERWIHYNAATGNFPTEEEMKTVKAVIIPGSSASVYDRHDGIKKLKSWIRVFDKNYPEVKMLGICFGAQIITEALGGRVDKMQQRKEDSSFYYRGSESLTVEEDFFDLPFVRKALSDDMKDLCIVEAHGDEIVELPRGFKNFASSKLCKNELFISEDLRYLAFQGHPEYDAEFIAAKSAMIIAEEDAESATPEVILRNKTEFIEKYFKDETTNDALRSICYSFLKRGTEIGSP